MNKNPFSQDIYTARTTPLKEDVRGAYFRDQTKIIHSLPFRRLKHKTQVFFAPNNDHICTRIEHVLHVSTIASTICRGLNASGNWDLNQDMAYAIGLAHDLGHAPFGHEGEKALSKCIFPHYFSHELNSYRVIEHLANYGEGLNLTYAVKDGVICHCGEDFKNNELRPSKKLNDLERITDRSHMPTTYEGCIVRLSDKIAYLGRDVEDAIKAKFITKADLPDIVRKQMGSTNGEIINTLVIDLIENCKDKDYIGFSEKNFEIADELRKFNYEYIYQNERMQERKALIDKYIKEMFDFFVTLFHKNKFDYKAYEAEKKPAAQAFGKYLHSMKTVYKEQLYNGEMAVVDYIAGMTDSFALQTMTEIVYIPIPFDI